MILQLLSSSSTLLNRYPLFHLLSFRAHPSTPLTSDTLTILMRRCRTRSNRPSIYRCITTCGSSLLRPLTTRLFFNTPTSSTQIALLPLSRPIRHRLSPFQPSLLFLFALPTTLLLFLALLSLPPLYPLPSIFQTTVSSSSPIVPRAPSGLVGTSSKLIFPNCFLTLPPLPVLPTVATIAISLASTPPMLLFLTPPAVGGCSGIASLLRATDPSTLALAFFSILPLPPTPLLTTPGLMSILFSTPLSPF
jgi:hypothetical protein